MSDHPGTGDGEGYRFSTRAVWLIADGCAAYWLARTDVLGTALAVIAGLAAAAVIFAVAHAATHRRPR